MDITAYILVLVASLGLVGVGRVLLPGSPAGRQFLAGLAIVGGICGSLAWVAPVAVVSVSRLFIAAGWIVNLLALHRGKKNGMPRLGGNSIVQGGLAAVIGIGLALPFHFRFFEIGDNTYFLGQVVEFFLADYTGPLRIPSFYPWELSASHILPSTTITAMGALLHRGTMLDGIEIRFLLLAFVGARFSYVVLRKSERPTPETVLLLLAGLLVFHREIYFGFRASTFVYVALVFEVALALFFDRTEDKLTARDVLFFLIAMAGGKASIFYLPVLVALWVVLRFPRLMSHPAILASGTVTFVQLLLTALQPRPFSDASFGLSLFNVTGGRAGFDYYPALSDALVNEITVPRFLPNENVVGILLIFLVVAVKYWAIPIQAIAGCGQPARRESTRIAEVFLLMALIGLVFIRHDQHGVTHQIWVFFGTAPLVLGAILARSVTAADSTKWRGGLLAVAAVVVAVGYNPWSAARSPSSPHLGDVTYEELTHMSDAEALVARPGEREAAVCERALLKGLRVQAGSVSLACAGTLGALAVEPKK